MLSVDVAEAGLDDLEYCSIDNSCAFAYDGECDETSGFCDSGTDTFDCDSGDIYDTSTGPVDCEWGSWSECDGDGTDLSTCGEGIRTRGKIVTEENGGTCTGVAQEPCNSNLVSICETYYGKDLTKKDCKKLKGLCSWNKNAGKCGYDSRNVDASTTDRQLTNRLISTCKRLEKKGKSSAVCDYRFECACYGFCEYM